MIAVQAILPSQPAKPVFSRAPGSISFRRDAPGAKRVRNVSLSNSRGKRRTIRKSLKRRKKKGGQLPVDLVRLAKIAKGNSFRS